MRALGFFIFWVLFLQGVPTWSILMAPVHRVGSILFIVMVLFYQTYLIATAENISKTIVILLIFFGSLMIKKGFFIYRMCSSFRKISGWDLTINEGMEGQIKALTSEYLTMDERMEQFIELVNSSQNN